MQRKPTFKIELSGERVLPETTRACDLADFIIGIEKSIVETAVTRGVELPDEAVVSLVGIEEGSNRLTLAAAALVLPMVGAISHAVSAKDYREIPRAAHEALYQVSRRAVERRWIVRFIEDRSAHIEEATISVESQVPEPPPLPEVKGTTTIYGRCVRVGGVKPRAEISLHWDETLFIDVSESIAKDLGRKLYEEVCLNGEATWEAETWTIRDFRAMRVATYSPAGLVSAFEQLAAAAESRWDGVDVDEYVRQCRHGDEQS